MAFIKFCLFFSLLFTSAHTSAAPLEFELQKVIEKAGCQTGIAVLKGDNAWIIGGNKKQPMLSVFKFLIALKVLHELDQRHLPLNMPLTIEKNMVDPNLYSPMLKKYKKFPVQISIAELLERMIAESDNNAADILLDFAGGAEKLEQYIRQAGFAEVTIQANEKEMSADISNQYHNTASPLDIAKLMRMARESSLLSSEHRLFLDKIMIKTSTGTDKLKKGLPADTVIGHKTGSSSRKDNGIKIADNDAGFVILPNGETYYIAVMLTDSAMTDQDNAKLIAAISEIVYRTLADKAKPQQNKFRPFKS